MQKSKIDVFHRNLAGHQVLRLAPTIIDSSIDLTHYNKCWGCVSKGGQKQINIKLRTIKF